ncbi:3-oxo-tetronate kinase [Agarilytica rhodophyticola]|uniref:3-oxo-tetronate kinase n=1 Tax=Agarilytica rhodophyticola TaxID=1737490 RepID=UPI000B341833|nr:3-oxo-tetronate kinase [Agarilytica rhodophyticola]
MSLLLGCIADDITGATDIALSLKRQGMRVVQTLGVPTTALMATADAVVVALKTRSIDPKLAVEASLEAIDWLHTLGTQQFYFKYCSTFDSDSQGNIGPVAEALLEYLDSDFTVVCPSFPTNHRTVYQGHLFVKQQLLAESSMRHHPITPMSDSNLVRLLDQQISDKAKTGLIPLNRVIEGSEAIAQDIAHLKEKNYRFAITDAISDTDLLNIAKACSDLPLVTGGSALAMGLANNYRQKNLLSNNSDDVILNSVEGHVAILVGSCSSSTQQQVKAASAHYPVISIDPIALSNQSLTIEELTQQALKILEKSTVIITSTATPEIIERMQSTLGKEHVSTLLEETFGLLGKRLVAAGIKKIIVAGGETSGAVSKALAIRQLSIGPQIDPGVPWTHHLGTDKLFLAFKSGNFGDENFFQKAVEMIA